MNDKRKQFFKILACDFHSWPILGCEECLNRLMEFVDEVAAAADYDTKITENPRK